MEQIPDTALFVADSLAQILSQQDSGGGQNILDLIGLAGGFQYPIFLVFVLGLGALMNTLVRVFNDGRSSTELRALDLKAMKTGDLKKASKHGGQSIHHTLLRKILHRTQYTQAHGDLLKTVGIVMQVQQEAHDMTTKLVTYCSSAAGGLGLAGTLVGMYSSFAAAGTDPNSVYVGISLALVSTLLGVAASLILETAETFVSRYAQKQSSRGRMWGEEVCARLSDLKLTADRINASGRQQNSSGTKRRGRPPKKTQEATPTAE